ncbi:MAG: ATP-binding protein [Phycisphaerae bacterium]|nr:ATP-binding protein [Phycisphaerae bacterium]
MTPDPMHAEFLPEWHVDLDAGAWSAALRTALAPLRLKASAVLDPSGTCLSFWGELTQFDGRRAWAVGASTTDLCVEEADGVIFAALSSATSPAVSIVVACEPASEFSQPGMRERVRGAMALAALYVQSEVERVEQRARVRQLLAEQRVLAGLHNQIVAENLNERELSAKDKQRLVAELERQLEARTLELRTTLTRAQEASLAKSRFLANMSHELRTPMTSILGYAELLLNGDISDEGAKSAVETIYRNGDHLLSLLNDILDLSRIESGKLPLERMKVDPILIARDSVELIRTRAKIKNVAAEVELLGPIPEYIETDPTRLRQILGNLLANAVKFTRAGSIRVRLGMETDFDGRPLLVMAVQDSGIGMTQAQLERVFEPYVQAEADTARRFGGTGLGLSISRKLARHLGGDLTAVSEIGIGSTFRLSIAVGSIDGVRMVDVMPLAADGRAATSAVPVASLKLRGRVLLAEDGPDNQRLIATLLQRAGIELTVVPDGRRAIEEVTRAIREETPYHLILMDLQMPDVDGLEATRALRGMSYRGPIVALTANAMVGDRDAALSAGCDDYVTKPINRALLFATLQRFLAGDREGPRFSTSDAPRIWADTPVR